MSGSIQGRTLVVLAHPALERSRVNAALAAAARGMPEAVVHDLYEAYPDFAVDVTAEQALLAASDPVVLQFPLYWHGVPALLKEWLDLVWLPGFAHGPAGRSLEGRTLLCAVSTGDPAGAFRPGGPEGFTIPDILRPFERAAARCGMRWAAPFAVHGAAALTGEALDAEAARYAARLGALAAGAGSASGTR